LYSSPLYNQVDCVSVAVSVRLKQAQKEIQPYYQQLTGGCLINECPINILMAHLDSSSYFYVSKSKDRTATHIKRKAPPPLPAYSLLSPPYATCCNTTILQVLSCSGGATQIATHGAYALAGRTLKKRIQSATPVKATRLESRFESFGNVA
jgi:hypothetical protein